jgi:2-polyprenyl-3-methyl-5-hydroxy-6-metoxy-1,4-benzoquinol methylase
MCFKLARRLNITKTPISSNLKICSCPACASKDYKYLFSQKEAFRYSGINKEIIFDLVQCRRCSMVFVNPRLKEDFTIEIYRKDLVETYKYYNSHRTEQSILFDAYHNKLEERKTHFSKLISTLHNFVPTGSILEIGSSFGYFLKACEEGGYEAYGIEPSQKCVDFAHRNLGIKNIACAKWQEVPFTKQFDAICMLSVIEHLYDPAGCLRYADTRLKAGGYLFVTCPILEKELLWREAHPIEHVNYFTEHTLKKLIKDTLGYEWKGRKEAFIFQKPRF